MPQSAGVLLSPSLIPSQAWVLPAGRWPPSSAARVLPPLACHGEAIGSQSIPPTPLSLSGPMPRLLRLLWQHLWLCLSRFQAQQVAPPVPAAPSSLLQRPQGRLEGCRCARPVQAAALPTCSASLPSVPTFHADPLSSRTQALPNVSPSLTLLLQDLQGSHCLQGEAPDLQSAAHAS